MSEDQGGDAPAARARHEFATARREAKEAVLTTNWNKLLEDIIKQGKFLDTLKEAYAYAATIVPKQGKGHSCPIRSVDDMKDLEA